MSAKRAYYAYYDDEKELYYYYEVFSQQTQWSYPRDGRVVDPETNLPFTDPDAETIQPRASVTPRALIRNNSCVVHLHEIMQTGFALEIDEDVQNFVPPQEEPPAPPHDLAAKLASCSDEPVYMPGDVKAEIQHFQIKDYAVEHFKKCSSGRKFTKAMVSSDSIVDFTPLPLKEPLLSRLPKNEKRNALKCFQYGLQYAGVNQRKSSEASILMMNLISNKPVLKDEVYFQLIKQTSQCPNDEWRKAYWELFLMMATVFPSTRNSENWIKSYLARECQSQSFQVATWAQFCYIRFCARCAIGQDMEYTNDRLSEIPNEWKTTVSIFGVSLYEIMWSQRRTLPNCPVPIFMHQMAEAMLAAGAEETEGIFRLPGNLKNVDRLAMAANMGDNVLRNVPLNDLASLFKKWVRELADPIVPLKMDELFRSVHGNAEWDEFVEKMPHLHACTLAYLIGFLQRLAKSRDKTKMGPENLAMVFGPNVVQFKVVATNEKEFIDKGKLFLQWLIENWDVSAVYPLSPSMLI